MGLLNPTISYNTGRIVDPLAAMRSGLNNMSKNITADEADKTRKAALALQVDRYAKADAQQALDNARTATLDARAKAVYDKGLAQEQADVDAKKFIMAKQSSDFNTRYKDPGLQQQGNKFALTPEEAAYANSKSDKLDKTNPIDAAIKAKLDAQDEFSGNFDKWLANDKGMSTYDKTQEAMQKFPNSKWASDFQFQQYGDKTKADATFNSDTLALQTKANDSKLKLAAMQKFGLGADGKPTTGKSAYKATQDDKDRSSIMSDDKFIPLLKNPEANKWLQDKLKAGYKASDLKNMVVNSGSPGSEGYIWNTAASFNTDTADKALGNYTPNAVYSDGSADGAASAKSNYDLEIAGIDSASLQAQVADRLQRQKDSERGYTDKELSYFGIAPEHPVNVAKKKVVAEAEKAKQEEAKKAAANYTPPAPVTPSTSDSMLERIKQIDAEAGATKDPRAQQRLRDERITIAKQLSVNATEQRQLTADEQQRSMLKRLGGQQVATDAGINVAEVPPEVITKAQLVIQQPSTVVGANGTTSILDSIRSNYSAGAPTGSALSTFNKYVLGDEVPQPLDSKMYSRIGHDEQAIRKQIGTNNPRETWETMYRLSQSPEDKAMFGKLIQLDKYDNDAEYRNNTQMSSAKHVAGNTVINAAGGPLLRGLGKVAGTALEYGGKLVPFTKSVSNVGKAITRASTAKKPVGFGQSTTAELSTKTGVADQAAYDATAKALELDKQILKRIKNVDKAAARKELIAAKEKVLKDTPQVTKVITESGGKFRPNEGTLATLTKSGRPSKEAQSQIDFIVESMGLNSKAAAKDVLKKRLAQDAEYRQKLYRNALLRTTGTITVTTGDQLTK